MSGILCHLRRNCQCTDCTSGQIREHDSPDYPMQVLNGFVVRKPDRQAPTSDYDLTPRQFRRYVDASGAQEMQLYNGLQRHIASGRIMGYMNEGYFATVVPQMPGYQKTGMNFGGFHKKGPDPLSVFAMFQNGPGSQPANPGGPGKIVSNMDGTPTILNNPGTG